GTTNDHTVPLPLITCQVTSMERHTGHIGRGGNRSVPQAPHACIRSSPCRAPSQNGAEYSSTCGRRNASFTAGTLPGPDRLFRASLTVCQTWPAKGERCERTTSG